jgi:site-specific DNA-methyltransferase (adenine-specific)
VTSWDLRLGRYQDVLAHVDVDALITDTPYSEKTHKGHRDGAEGYDGYSRDDLSYAAWTPDDVVAFVREWAPRTRGWFVTLTDTVLAPAWEAALEEQGRYVFAPLPFVAPGSRVRTRGDGPSCWTTQIVVARPRTALAAAWGTLDGAYVLPRGLPRYEREQFTIGGKPLWLMRRLVEDYTRPGDLVCDPCAGPATTLLAAALTGRYALGASDSRRDYLIGCRRLERADRSAA